jgi:hypothetical protein
VESVATARKKPSPTNVIVGVNALTEILEKTSRCPECDGNIEASVRTVCIASQIVLTCKDAECGFQYASKDPASAKIDDNDDDVKRTTDFATIILYVLGFISAGDGGTEAARLLGLLGLPNDTTMEQGLF